MKILVTGGAGYIGTHTLVELMAAGHEVVVVDNLSNSSPKSLERVTEITGQEPEFHEFDLQDADKLNELFEKHHFDGVIHFAGLKSVGESTQQPLKYYRNNINSTLSLLEVMQKHQVYQLVFSSSATVYGNPEKLPITEDSKVGDGLTNPYGKTKYFIEEILEDLSKTDEPWQITSLRYFNPIGAHESGKIGEQPNGIPNNVAPYITQVAVGKRQHLNIFGDDYSTPDGTGVRDYIHVVDLAKAHLKAIEKPTAANQYRALNVGTGKGTSVLELLKAFEAAAGKEIPYQIAARRPGDIASCYAEPALINQTLGWQAEKSVHDAAKDAWKWQSENPEGF